MVSGLNYGIQPSMPHFFGICFGFPVMFLVLGFGLGYVFDLYPVLHNLIKVVGVVYILYLSWLIAVTQDPDLNGQDARPLTFFQGALFQWVNPKAWVMGSSAIAAFTTAEASLYLQIIVIAFIFFLFTFPCAGAWLYFGRYLKQIIKDSKKQRAFNLGMAVLLVFSVYPVVLELLENL